MGIYKSVGAIVAGRFKARYGLDFTRVHPRCSSYEIKFKTGDTLGATSAAAGSSMRWLSYNTATTGKNALEIKLTQTGILASGQSSRGLYVNVNNESTTNVDGEITAGEFKVRSSSSDTASVKGIHVSIDAKGYDVALARGIEISIDAGELTHGGYTTVEGIRIANNSSGSQTRAIGLSFSGPRAMSAHIAFGTTQAAGTTTEGDFWYDAGSNVLKFYNGSNVKTITTN